MGKVGRPKAFKSVKEVEEKILSKGFVEEGKILEDKQLIKKEIIEDKED